MSKHISVVFPGQGSQSQGMTDILSSDELNNIGYIKSNYTIKLQF